MAVDVTMPRLSDSMEEGTVLRWMKAVGDEVRRGDELVEIETDKASMTYEAIDEGVLVEIVAAEGETLPIGAVIARVGDRSELHGGSPAPAGGGAASASAPPPAPADRVPAKSPASAEPPAPAAAPPVAPAPAPAGDGDGRVKASPVARRMARELRVELRGLRGTGPGGRIVKADVEAATRRPAAPAPAAATAPAPGAAGGPSLLEAAKGAVEIVELTRLQATVARRMAESKATVPHFHLESDVDMSEAVAMRAQLKELAGEGSTPPTYNDMVVKACGLALREHPRANGAYRDGRVELHARVNVGLAVAGQDALVVPTVFDADRKSLGEIAAETRALAQRVRDGMITPPELSGGTFTVSNLGMFGVTSFSAVINPPQAALLAVGALGPRAVADAGTGGVAVRQMMSVTLACDHRILYGADGARFLARVRELLERPLAMAL